MRDTLGQTFGVGARLVGVDEFTRRQLAPLAWSRHRKGIGVGVRVVPAIDRVFFRWWFGFRSEVLRVVARAGLIVKNT